MDSFIAILTSITALIVAISTLIKNMIEAKKNNLIPHRVKSQSSINMNIINLMEDAKERFRADRIQVYDYHNGGHFANGRSALKVSCTYEVVRSGIRSCQQELQGIPLTFIAKFNDMLLNNNTLYIKDLETIKETMPFTYQIKHNQQIKSFYDIILNNKQGEPIGFLGVQYNNNDIVISEEDKKEILKFKLAIENELEKMVKGGK